MKIKDITLEEEVVNLKKVVSKVGWPLPEKDPMGIRQKLDNIVNLLIKSRLPNSSFCKKGDFAFTLPYYYHLQSRFRKILLDKFTLENKEHYIDSVLKSVPFHACPDRCYLNNALLLISILIKNCLCVKMIVEAETMFSLVLNTACVPTKKFILKTCAEIKAKEVFHIYKGGVACPNTKINTLYPAFFQLIDMSKVLIATFNNQKIIGGVRVISDPFIQLGLEFLCHLHNKFKPDEFYPILEIM